MTALTQDRNSPQRMALSIKAGFAAASTLFYAGAIIMRATATGHLTKGQTALNLVGVGVTVDRVTSGGVAGVDTVRYRDDGSYRFANSSAGDAIVLADIGNPCYAVDDQTVAKTSATNTRSIAGFIADVDTQGVWVRFDEHLARAWLT